MKRLFIFFMCMLASGSLWASGEIQWPDKNTKEFQWWYELASTNHNDAFLRHAASQQAGDGESRVDVNGKLSGPIRANAAQLREWRNLHHKSKTSSKVMDASRLSRKEELEASIILPLSKIKRDTAIGKLKNRTNWIHRLPKKSRKAVISLLGMNEGTALYPFVGIQVADAFISDKHHAAQAKMLNPESLQDLAVGTQNKKLRQGWDVAQRVSDAALPLGLIGAGLSRHILCLPGFVGMGATLLPQIVDAIDAVLMRKKLQLSPVEQQAVWNYVRSMKPADKQTMVALEKRALSRLKHIKRTRLVKAAVQAMLPLLFRARNSFYQKAGIQAFDDEYRFMKGDIQGLPTQDEQDLNKQVLKFSSFGLGALWVSIITAIIHKALLINHRHKMAKDVRQLLAAAEAAELEKQVPDAQPREMLSMVHGPGGKARV